MRQIPSDVPFDSRGPRRLVKTLLVAILLFGLLSTGVGFYIDKLWFESLGFESVYWYSLEAQAATFGVFFVATAVMLWLGFRMVLAVSGEARRAFIEIQGRLIGAPSAQRMKGIARWIALVLALVIAAIASSTSRP